MKRIKVSRNIQKYNCPFVDFVNDTETQGMEIIADLSMADPSLSGIKPPNQFIACMQEVIKEINNYPTDYSVGFLETRQAIIKDLYTSIGDICTIKPDDIFQGYGQENCISEVLRQVLNPGDEFQCLAPRYGHHTATSSTCGFKEILFELDTEGNVDNDLINNICTEKCKLLLQFDPMNPQGNVLKDETLKQLMNVARQHNLIQIQDNESRKINWSGVDTTKRVFTYAKELGVEMIYCGSVAQDYALCGYRLGWLVKFGKNLDKIWDHLKSFRLQHSAPNSLIQKGFADFLNNHEDSSIEWRKDLLENYKENAKYLQENLHGFENIVDVPECNATVCCSIYILDIEKLQFDNDMAMCEEFLEMRQYKVIPLSKIFGGSRHGMRVQISHERSVYVGFVTALKEFILDSIAGEHNKVE